MTTLTKEDVTALTKHFHPNEHEFTRGFIYITESAVGNRLDEVDPAWSWEIINEWTRDNQAICAGRLTICGVSRDGVGMQPLTIVSSKDGKVLEGTEPEKSAATDALKRAARLFGIGRYLLDTPGWVKTVADVEKWLPHPASNGNHAPPLTERPTTPPSQNGTHGDNGKTIDFPNQKPATPKNAPPAPEGKDGHPSAMLMLGDLIDSPDLKQFIDQENHRRATVNLLAKHGIFENCETTPDMMARVIMYIDVRAKGTVTEKSPEDAVAAVKAALKAKHTAPDEMLFPPPTDLAKIGF